MAAEGYLMCKKAIEAGQQKLLKEMKSNPGEKCQCL